MSHGTGRYTAVAWRGAELWAGAVDGLYRVDGDGLQPVSGGYSGGWVTDIEVAGERVYVGTYADGLWQGDGRSFAVVPALVSQWVPAAGLTLVPGALWAGGLGMPAVRLDLASGLAAAVAVPVRDVNRALVHDGAVWLATSDGVVRLGAPPVAAR